MFIDFILNDTDIDENEAKNIIQNVVNTKIINSITIPYYLIKSTKNIIQNSSINSPIDFSCLIDYPLGISDSKTRDFAVTQAIKSGTTTIDIVMPQNLAANRKYDKIREDIKNITTTCMEKNTKVRYILEYRIFDHHCLKKICEIFESFGIKYVFPSSGYFLDNLADNIIASVFLHQNSKDLNIICSGNVWNTKHFELINKSGLFGFRTNSYHALKNFLAFNYANQKK
jgi:deoxyribose-phosphate aldolase